MTIITHEKPTVTVNAIEGSRKNAARNDAYSLVRNDFEVIDFIPRYELKPEQDRETVLAAFRAAVDKAPAAPAPQIRAAVRRDLGLRV